MNVKDPVTLATAWLLVPLLVVAVSAGLGVGIRLLAGWELGALTVPAGYMAGIALITAGLQVRLDVTLVIAGCLALAAAGPAVALWIGRGSSVLPRLRELARAPAALWAAGSAVVAYGIAMAPVAGSGRSAVAGYLLNNDNAIHVSLIEAIAQYGPNPVTNGEDSFLATTGGLTTGYPLGAYAWPLLGRVVTGVEPFHLWSPLIAVTAGMLALVTFSVLRSLSASAPFAAIAAALVPSSYLLYSFLDQSGAKEIVLAFTVVAALVLAARPFEERVTWRALVPAAVASAAAVANFGAAVGAWLAPAAAILLVILIARGARGRSFGELRSAGVYVLVATPIAIPALLESLKFYDDNISRLQNPADVGNLLGPLPVREVLGIWFSQDYRFDPPDWQGATTVGVVLATVIGLLGVAYAIRHRRLALPLAIAAGIVAPLIVYPRVSIYYESKTLLPIAAAAAIAIAAGVLALLRARRVPSLAALGVGCLLAAGVLVSDALVYTGTWLTPKDRFAELSNINERFAGAERTLFVDREQWGMYLLRDTGPWDDWGDRQPSRNFIDALPPNLPHAPEFDDYPPEHFHRFDHLVERKRPGSSLPPSNFAPVYETAHYRVWRRTGPDPAAHLAVGRLRRSGTAALRCRSEPVRALLADARRLGANVRVAWRRDQPVTVVPTDAWVAFEPARYIAPPPLVSRKGGTAARTVVLPRGRYRVWLQGFYGPGVRVFVGQRPLTDVLGDPALPSQWKPAGILEADGKPVTFSLSALDRSLLLSGSDQAEQSGPLIVEPLEPRRGVAEIPPERLSRFCDRQVDWLEIPPPT